MQVLKDRVHMINEVDGFSSIGSKPSHYWCGIWQTFGCLNHKSAYIKQFKRTCFRPECKTCCFSWSLRQSKRSLAKINRMRKTNTVKHSVLILTQTWSKESRKQLIKKLKDNGVESACIIFTPFDESNNSKFFLQNTIHIFYTGMIQGNHYPQNDLDGTNKTLFKTLQNQFLNVGIKQGLHFISWIGKSPMMYCTLNNDTPKQNGKNCPICNKKLKLIYYSGDKEKIPPDEYFDGEIEKDGWIYCVTDSFFTKLFKKIKRFVNTCNKKIKKGIRFYPNYPSRFSFLLVPFRN